MHRVHCIVALCLAAVISFACSSRQAVVSGGPMMTAVAEMGASMDPPGCGYAGSQSAAHASWEEEEENGDLDDFAADCEIWFNPPVGLPGQWDLEYQIENTELFLCGPGKTINTVCASMYATIYLADLQDIIEEYQDCVQEACNGLYELYILCESEDRDWVPGTPPSPSDWYWCRCNARNSLREGMVAECQTEAAEAIAVLAANFWSDLSVVCCEYES